LKNLNILRKYDLPGKISKYILGRCKKMTGKIPQPVGQKNYFLLIFFRTIGTEHALYILTASLKIIRLLTRCE